MLILIVGAKRVGKSTIADLLVEREGFLTRAVADPLKDILSETLDMSREEMDIVKNEEKIEICNGLNMRQLLQNFGQSAKKHMGNDVWCRASSHDIDTKDDYVISDIRLMIEYDFFVKKWGKENVVVIKIVGNSDKNENTDLHSTEQEWKQIPADITYINTFDGQDKYFNDVWGKVKELRK